MSSVGARLPAGPAGEPLTLVFDVGLVLIDADYASFLRFMREHGAEADDMEAFCSAVDLDAHERGEVGPEEFLDRLSRAATRVADRHALLAAWNGMYRPVAPMVEFVRDASTRQPVHLLSNMGELHWRHLESAFGIPSLGHGAVASYTVGALKPEPSIYAAIEARFGLVPERTVFIDDRPVNVAAARARGWRGIVHVTPQATLAALAALGVTVRA
jgi:HAD superfamily hydrolase (TIGR01509 family)